MAVFTQFESSSRVQNLWKYRLPTANYFIKRQFGQQALISHSLENVSDMKRILILGSSGSGKSTLARHLGAKLELPVIHLDRHYWNPGWEPTPENEWQNEVENLIKRPSWIIDGNYRSTLDMRIKAADTIIFLDLPPALCATRAIKRRFMYINQPRPDISTGCKEKVFDPKFPRFVRWILDYPNRARPDVVSRLVKHGKGKRIIWLQSSQQVHTFLEKSASDQKEPMLPLPLEESGLETAVFPQMTTD